MKKYLLLHGWGGSDAPHWQSWLAGELVKNYNSVTFLPFSDPHKPKLDVWIKELQKVMEDLKPDVVICHSLANTLWFHLCKQGAFSDVKKLYLVAPPSCETEIPELSTFFPVTPPKNLCAKEALLITSTNDPYLDPEEANELQQQLDIPMNVILNGGHINSKSGFGAWEWILQEVLA